LVSNTSTRKIKYHLARQGSDIRIIVQKSVDVSLSHVTLQCHITPIKLIEATRSLPITTSYNHIIHLATAVPLV